MVRGGGVMGSRVNWGGVVRSGGGVVGSRRIRIGVGNMMGSGMVDRGVVYKWGVVGSNMGVCVGWKMRSMVGHSHANEGQNTENLRKIAKVVTKIQSLKIEKKSVPS